LLLQSIPALASDFLFGRHFQGAILVLGKLLKHGHVTLNAGLLGVVADDWFGVRGQLGDAMAEVAFN
jgi:hypothetical protein